MFTEIFSLLGYYKQLKCPLIKIMNKLWFINILEHYTVLESQVYI